MPAHSPEGLSGGIVRLIQNRRDRIPLGAEARRRVQSKYTTSQMVEGWRSNSTAKS